MKPDTGRLRVVPNPSDPLIEVEGFYIESSGSVSNLYVCSSAVAVQASSGSWRGWRKLVLGCVRLVDNGHPTVVLG